VAPVNTGGHSIADGALPFGARDAALVDGSCQLAASTTNHGAVVHTMAREQLLPGGWHTSAQQLAVEIILFKEWTTSGWDGTARIPYHND
jgi:hypothetical protein